MLRESIEISGESINLDGLTDPACTRIEGIPHSDVLLTFANAFMEDDPAGLAAARQNLVNEMGMETMVDAVGVVSSYQRMVRIADATGIPTDDPIAIMQEDLAEQLGTNKYVSAANTKRSSWFKRLLLKLVVIPKIRKLIKDQSK